MKTLVRVGGFFLFFLFAPSLTHAATLYLSPAKGSYGVGSTIVVSVRTNTAGQAVNTAEATVSFSTNTLQVVSVRSGATFYLTTPGSPSKTVNSAYFAGGLPTPGYTGTTGVLGTITLRAIAEGTATVSIDNGRVLLNDGSGTNALTGTSGAQFTITKAAPTPPPGVLIAPVVISTSHPSSTVWYSDNDTVITWNRPEGAYGFSFDFDQKLDTIPDTKLDAILQIDQTYTDLDDGIWYFHIAAAKQGTRPETSTTTHLMFQIDTEAPEPFDINFIGDVQINNAPPTLTISFDAQDAVSGVDHYAIFVDNRVVDARAQSPYTFANLTEGPHIIKVIAYDKAGNEQRATTPVIIGKEAVLFLQQKIQLSMFALLLIALAFILILLRLITYMVRSRKQHKKKSEVSEEVKQLQKEIDKNLGLLKLQINQDVQGLLQKSSDKIAKLEKLVIKELDQETDEIQKAPEEKPPQK